MQVFLKLMNGEEMEQVIGSDSFVIGRSPKCDVVVPHDGMSRQHCQIDLIGGELYVTDLGSTNGVMIDGKKIEPHVKTRYATYLTLSFGAVQNLQIELDELTSTIAIQKPLKKSTSHQGSGTGGFTITKTKASGEAPKSSTDSKLKVKTKEKDSPNWLMNVLAVLILLGAVWWYVQKDKLPGDDEDTGPSPEAPQKTYDQF